MSASHSKPSPRPNPCRATATARLSARSGVPTRVLPTARYVERGISSWYGNKFHGYMTSSFEPYDMYKFYCRAQVAAAAELGARNRISKPARA